MMAMREKLIELLSQVDACICTLCGEEGALERVSGVIADSLLYNGVTIQKWIPVTERLPKNFISVLGYMTDAGDFPPVRECYTVGNAFFFPALGDVHPVSHWMPLPEPPEEV